MTGGDLVLVDFWAEWCPPCRMFGPVFEKASEKHPDAVFGKVDTEAQPEVAATFNITSIPTLMIIRDNIVLSVQHVERTAIEMRHHIGVDHLMFATDFPHIECDWPETRSYVERMFAGVPWDEAYPILAGNMIKFFHLEDTPMAQKVEAQAKVAVWS